MDKVKKQPVVENKNQPTGESVWQDVINIAKGEKTANGKMLYLSRALYALYKNGKMPFELYFDIQVAKRFCTKEQKVIKVPNTNVFKIVAPLLVSRGISRIVTEDKLISL